MERPDQDELTDLIHQQLMKLPERTAPATLIPRVLRRIERRQHCWWLRPWGTWPFSAKLFSLPLMIGCLGMFSLGLKAFSGLPLGAWIMSGAEDLLRPLTSIWDLTLTLSNAFWVALQSFNQPIVWVGVVSVVFLMYLTCLAVGTMCVRVAYASRRNE
jgi:hypothetical protein